MHMRNFDEPKRLDVRVLTQVKALFRNNRKAFCALDNLAYFRTAVLTDKSLLRDCGFGAFRAAIANGEVVFAWTESADGGGLQVRTAAAKLP